MMAAARTFLACALLAVTACATLPDARLYIEGRNPAPVQVDGARGPLSRQKTEALLAELKRKSGDLDILQKHVAIEQEIVGAPLSAGNKTLLLQDGPATYREMIEAMNQAKDHINLETYTFEDDEVGREFADILLVKQAQGVQVNVIYDSVGSIGTPRAFFERLTQNGVRVLEFNPVNPLTARKGWQINHRDHRKLLVVDGQTAFVGGINISSVYSSGSSPGRSGRVKSGSGGWRDTHIRIDGPAVAGFQQLFLSTWEKQKGDPLAERKYFPVLTGRGPDLVRSVGSTADEQHSLIYLTLISALTNAEKSIHITQAYFVPDAQFMRALTDAAKRGVDVALVLPGTSDLGLVFHAGRSYYADLLEAGVHIYERSGGVLHSKTAVIDDVWSCIGSTNLDWRSFLHNDEVNAVVLGTLFARQMQDMFERDVAASMAITPQAWAGRGLQYRLKEMAARVWAYWL
ncbi:MAG: cardiolipin synthetase 2 [Betaproteobacteria bacterium]|nr:cardiolipin synthetase 2 [Betaproteobacteria bacterium]